MQTEHSSILDANSGAILSAIDGYARKLDGIEKRAALYRALTVATVHRSMTATSEVPMPALYYKSAFNEMVLVPAQRYAEGVESVLQELLFRLGQSLTVRAYVEHCSAREALAHRQPVTA